MTHDFSLTFELRAGERDPDRLMASLREAGCTDALIGIGSPGHVELTFAREAALVEEAVLSALADAGRALPAAELVGVRATGSTVVDLLALRKRQRQEQALERVAENARELGLDY